MPVRIIVTVAALALLAPAGTARAADKPFKEFARAWERSRVVLKQPLYTLVYDEISRKGKRRERLEGLTVTTPSSGTYFEFAGREDAEDIRDRDANRVFNAVAAGYARQIEPKLLVRSERGVELVITRVEVNGDRIRLSLRKSAEPFETSLTLKWPVTLSDDFTERPLVEGILDRFLDR